MDTRNLIPGAPQWQPLRPHPGDGFAGDLGLEVWVIRDDARSLRVHYRLSGDLERLVVPAHKGARRVDGLWKTTCLELFVAGEGDAYVEYNMAPGGAWAAYEFEAYRRGGRDAPVPAPEVDWQMGTRAWQVQARLLLPDALARTQAPLRASVCAVIEWRGGDAGGTGLSYWATHHARVRPDFHDRESFVLEPGSPS